MLSVEEALRAVLENTRALNPRRVSLESALGAVLAEDVAADLDSPPFDKALVDGYAVRASDLTGDRRLRVVEEITAGRVPSRPIGPNEAASIMTGAPLPDGADAVVMVERTRRDGDLVVIEPLEVRPGHNRLARAREMRKDEVVLSSGIRLNAPRLGLLASVGRTTVQVVSRPRVAIVSTGDELVEPDQVVGPGQIRNSNATVLRALAVSAGAEVVGLSTARDEPEELGRTLSEALASADLVLITGGVSAGNRDLVPATLARLGVERVFHKVRLKPGKPLWFGRGPGLVFGLPGNPVSGIVGFLLFVRPALEVLAGLTTEEGSSEAILSTTFRHAGDRPTYHPATLSFRDGNRPEVTPLDWAGSADLRTVARADGFAVFPAGDRAHEAGEIVRFLPLG